MSYFTTIKKRFRKLSSMEQETLLHDIYTFSKDIRLFLEEKLLDGDIPAQEFIQQMKKETIDKIYRHGTPGTIDGRVINSILRKANKSGMGFHTILILEKLAYRGFIEFLNEFGGGPESFDEQACNHLEAYLRLVKEYIAQEEREQIFQEVNEYLRKKNNMITDMLYDTYHEVVGKM